MKRFFLLFLALFIASSYLSYRYAKHRKGHAAGGEAPVVEWVDADGDGRREKLVFCRTGSAAGEYDRFQIYEGGWFRSTLAFDSRSAGLDMIGGGFERGGPLYCLEDGDGDGHPEIRLREDEADGGLGRMAIVEGRNGRYAVLFFGVLQDPVYEDLDGDGRRELHGCTGDTIGDLLFPLRERTVFVRASGVYRPSTALTRRLAERELNKAAGDFLAAPSLEGLFVLVNYHTWLGRGQEAAVLIAGSAERFSSALDGAGVPIEYYLDDLMEKMVEYEAWWEELRREEEAVAG